MNESTRENFYLAILNHHLNMYRNGETDANGYMTNINEVYDQLIEEASEDDELHNLVYQLEQHMDYMSGQITSESEH
jgi:hypothetical protein